MPPPKGKAGKAPAKPQSAAAVKAATQARAIAAIDAIDDVSADSHNPVAGYEAVAAATFNAVPPPANPLAAVPPGEPAEFTRCYNVTGGHPMRIPGTSWYTVTARVRGKETQELYYRPSYIMLALDAGEPEAKRKIICVEFNGKRHDQCGQPLTKGGGMSNFLAHLAAKHPAVLAREDRCSVKDRMVHPVTLEIVKVGGGAAAAAEDDAGSSALAIRKKPGGIAAFIAKTVDVGPPMALALSRGIFVKNYVDKWAFRAFITDIGLKGGFTPKIPSRRALGLLLDDQCEQQNWEVMDFVHKIALADGGSLSMTMDFGSTEGSFKSVLGLTFHFLSRDFDMYSVVAGAMYSPGSHDTPVVEAWVRRVLKRAKISVDCLASVTRDGGTNMNVFGDLDSVFDIWCLLHQANNAAKFVYNNPEETLLKGSGAATRGFDVLMASVRDVIMAVRSSTKRRDMLADLQRRDGVVPKQLLTAPDHKFFYWDAQVGSVVALYKYLVLLNPEEMGATRAEKDKIRDMLSNLTRDIADLRVLLPILNAASELCTLLSTSSRPIIGHTKAAVTDLYEACDAAVANAKNKSLENAEAIALHFRDEFACKLDPIITSSLFRIATLLTPTAAVYLTSEDVDESFELLATYIVDDAKRKDAALAAAAAAGGAAGPAGGVGAGAWEDGAEGIDVDAADMAAAAAAAAAAAVAAAAATAPPTKKARVMQFAGAAAGPPPEADRYAPLRAALARDRLAFRAQLSDVVARVTAGEDVADLAVWAAIVQRGEMRVIAPYARKFLAFQPTQIASERIFNRVKIVSSGQAMLTMHRLERLVMSAMNMAAIERDPKYVGYRKVVSDDDAFAAEDDAQDVADLEKLTI